jgi:hemerythrin-like domain-containing protein
MDATSPLPSHHKHCDDLFADAEAAVNERRWADGKRNFLHLQAEMLAHFATEEDVLFPAFEKVTGMTGGPTHMMRFEHTQMRALLTEMANGVDAGDATAFSGSAETLLVLMQQHNMKEENILYPMCDRALPGNDLHIDEELRARVASTCRD